MGGGGVSCFAQFKAIYNKNKDTENQERQTNADAMLLF